MKIIYEQYFTFYRHFFTRNMLNSTIQNVSINLNKLCSKFEVDISRNELSVKKNWAQYQIFSIICQQNSAGAHSGLDLWLTVGFFSLKYYKNTCTHTIFYDTYKPHSDKHTNTPIKL